MDNKFNKDSGGSRPQEAPREKKNQSALLLLLLILVGGFAYLYFFTDLIKPLEVQKTAEAPAAAPQTTKMPLPPREGEPAQAGAKEPVKTEAPQAAAATPVPAPKTSPVKLKGEPQKVAAVKPAAKKLQQTPVKGTAHKAAVTKVAEKKTAAKRKNNKTDSWSLVIGNYVLEEALSADMGHVRKAGFVPVIKPAGRKKTTMSRLFVSEFDDRAAAKSTLEKLKRYTSDAFIIEQDRKFAVYAGSYLQTEAVNSEQKRLKGAGIATIVRHSEIAIPSNFLSIGPFKSRNAADAAIYRLKNAGIKATLSQN